jgi:uncharacterized protein YqcC (DUF446 family)
MHSEIADVLLNIELELRRLDLWSQVPATQEQLMSSQPFCIDTMIFPEWIQFVLIERLKPIIEGGLSLPKTSGIAPMAEEYFKHEAIEASAVISLLKRFDQLIAGS